jgi:hypothetical protein
MKKYRAGVMYVLSKEREAMSIERLRVTYFR